MRILIVSDLHANLEAVRALPESYDEMWVLGDLVNYGPNPCEVIEFVRAHASLIVRGNHDHSAGYDRDAKCSERFRRLAEETGRYTRAVITEDQRDFLRSLPLTAERTVEGVRFSLCHATPPDPLYEYRAPDSPLWDAELARASADVLLVGHTHLPFCRRLGSRMVVNPGSAGQPKNGAAPACYAIWEGGEIVLESAHYPVEETVGKIRALPVSPELQAGLIRVLRAAGE
ncbi:MAG: YfcE family phosphodiesterase [Bryobacteraceae bacterium]|jgi:protein phosphatase